MSISPWGCRALLGAAGTRAVPPAGYFGSKPPRRDDGCFPEESGEDESIRLVTSSPLSHCHRVASAKQRPPPEFLNPKGSQARETRLAALPSEGKPGARALSTAHHCQSLSPAAAMLAAPKENRIEARAHSEAIEGEKLVGGRRPGRSRSAPPVGTARPQHRAPGTGSAATGRQRLLRAASRGRKESEGKESERTEERVGERSEFEKERLKVEKDLSKPPPCPPPRVLHPYRPAPEPRGRLGQGRESRTVPSRSPGTAALSGLRGLSAGRQPGERAVAAPSPILVLVPCQCRLPKGAPRFPPRARGQRQGRNGPDQPCPPSPEALTLQGSPRPWRGPPVPREGGRPAPGGLAANGGQRGQISSQQRR
ncbi:PREDICTED: basic salivary proline-rich protein 4-like [Sturnus vulgaris]|uniref:basic salivary proline-rich protein 4-like n=1 Tax=Sturnus vulgaris TaxID=9172 RepID=UPI00071A62D1|nr:PREDICTED: basic salivary proline-rich protein 4-like [Sturnus vulgaris]